MEQGHIRMCPGAVVWTANVSCVCVVGLRGLINYKQKYWNEPTFSLKREEWKRKKNGHSNFIFSL